MDAQRPVVRVIRGVVDTKPAIKVWTANDADRPRFLDWDETLDAFGRSFYAEPKTLPMSIEERVHLFIDRFGTFVAPDARHAKGDPSLSAEDYARFMAEAAERVAR